MTRTSLPDFGGRRSGSARRQFDYGIGSFLVTPEEAGNVRALEVKLTIGNHEPLKSDTSDYFISPEEAVSYLLSITIIEEK